MVILYMNESCNNIDITNMRCDDDGAFEHYRKNEYLLYTLNTILLRTNKYNRQSYMKMDE